MGDSGTVRNAGDVGAQIAAMVGQPVRMTILDAQSRERLVRMPGSLVSVGTGAMVVESIQPGSGGINDPVTVELLAGAYLFWCHTTIQSAERGLYQLRLPDHVQTIQRRRHPRVDMAIPVHLLVKQGVRVFPADLRDLSAGGASLRAEEPLLDGQQVSLVFSLGSGLFFQDLRAVTVRCASTPDGAYTVGLRFQCSPEQEATLGAWVERQLAAAAASLEAGEAE